MSKAAFALLNPIEARAIALEAIDFAATAKTIAENIQGLGDFVSKSVDGFVTVVNNATKSPDSTPSKMLVPVDWQALSKVEVAIPVGVTGSLLKYVEVLESSFDFLNKLVPEELKSNKIRISRLISDTTYRTSFAADAPQIRKAFDALKIHSQVLTTFNSKTVETSQKLGAVFNRFADIQPYLGKLHHLHLKVKAQNLNALNSQAKQLTNLVDEFIEQQKDGKIGDMSSSIAVALSEDLTVLGNAMNFYAGVISAVIALESSKGNIVDAVKAAHG